MTWTTHYLNEDTRQIARLIDEFPYHAPLIVCAGANADLAARRLANLRAAYAAEAQRGPTVTHVPYHLVIDVSDICNLACPLCVQATDPHGRKRTTMRLETAKRAIDAFERLPIRVELFSWGEPLLAPTFVQIAKLASEAAVFARTSSHLSLPKPIDAEAIVGSGLKSLVVSIDGATQDVYGHYRVHGKLEVVLENLHQLVAAKRRGRGAFPIVEWQYLCLRHNLHEIETALGIAKKIGVDVFRFGGARGVMMERNRVSDAENHRSALPYLLEGGHPLSEYDESGQRRNAWERSHCRWLWGKLAIHADGGVSPCWTSWRHEEDFGSVNHHSLEEIWCNRNFNEARLAAEKHKSVVGPPELCARCAANQAFVNAPERFNQWPVSEHLTRLIREMSLLGFPPLGRWLEAELG